MFEKKLKSENSHKIEPKIEQNDMNKTFEEQLNTLEGDKLIDFLLDTAEIIYSDKKSYKEKQEEFNKVMPTKQKTIKLKKAEPPLNPEPEYKPDSSTTVYKKFNYQRILYLKDLLLKIQAKEQKPIPQELINSIESELKKYRKTFDDLDYNLTRKILKDIGKSNYYQNIYSIIYLTNKKRRLVIPKDIEDRLCHLFELIQEPYDKHKGTRDSFLSYPYTMYKFFELLGYDDFLFIFPKPILKNRQKIYEHDVIWKKICKELDLPYYATI